MDSDNIELIEHSPYYPDADFQNLLKLYNTFIIMSLNSQCINAKFDEVQLIIDRINTSGSLGILCLQESWTDINEDISPLDLLGYMPLSPTLMSVLVPYLLAVQQPLPVQRTVLTPMPYHRLETLVSIIM